ncbi:MAG: hypothetical protein DBO98_05045 [Candidatus Liberibacter europaeus]|nr:hypothetical protein [Candidatus Liberibacter europaeus]
MDRIDKREALLDFPYSLMISSLGASELGKYIYNPRTIVDKEFLRKIKDAKTLHRQSIKYLTEMQRILKMRRFEDV